jgi:formiminotetrahydrofolate cyclodeaminase
MEVALTSMEPIKKMAEIGNPASASDAGVGALCARTAAMAAFLNVKTNTTDLGDKALVEDYMKRGTDIIRQCMKLEAETLELVAKHF